MKVRPTYHVSLTFDLRLTEQMARALAKADDWGIDVVVKGATAHIPEREAVPVRDGLTALFRAVGEQLDGCLSILDQHRRDIDEAEHRRQQHRDSQR